MIQSEGYKVPSFWIAKRLMQDAQKMSNSGVSIQSTQISELEKQIWHAYFFPKSIYNQNFKF